MSKIGVTSVGSGNRRAAFCVCLFLVVAVWVVFGQTLHYGFVNFDDDVYVFNNPKVMEGLSWSNILWFLTHYDSGFYHPLTMISLMLDYQFHGLHAAGYHFTNVLLHTVSAVLLFLVLREMTGALWRSAFVAVVFAIHPLRVESVAWVAERKDVLSGLFFMLTIGAYVRYVRGSQSLGRYFWVIIFYAFCLLSKPTAVTLPFVLLLLDYWPLNRFKPSHPHGRFTIPKRLILEKIPLLCMAAACAVAVFTQGKPATYTRQIDTLDIPLRVNNALVSYATYLGQMVWPAKLAAFYPYPINGIPLWQGALSLVLLVAISAGCFIWWRSRPYLLVGWLWYLGMLVPMIEIIRVGVFARADRYTYLTQIGLYILLTWMVVELTSSWRNRRWVLGGGALVVLVALITCARAQTAYWHDSESLWTHTLACTTNNSIAHNNLGGVFRDQGRIEESLAQFQKAFAIGPDYAEFHNNLGAVFARQGQKEESIEQFQKALAIKPDYAEAHYNLGNAFFRQGYMPEAISEYQKALVNKPDYMEAENNLALALATCPQASLRNGIEAVRLAERANQLANGKNPAVLCTLAAAYAETGRFSEAIETAQRALHLAEAQSNTALTGELQSQLKLYQAGMPFYGKE